MTFDTNFDSNIALKIVHVHVVFAEIVAYCYTVISSASCTIIFAEQIV